MSDKSAPSNEDWIVLTPEAREKAVEYLKSDDQGCNVVRINFDEKGKIGLVLDTQQPTDRAFSQGNVTVVVTSSVADVVKGLRVEFNKESAGFALSGTAQGLDLKVGLKAYETAKASEPAAAHDHGHEGAPHDHTHLYLSVAGALTILTIVELLGTKLGAYSKTVMILFLVSCAIVKAGLVGLYFMHLSLERRWKYVVLVPPMILAVVLVVLLMPDVGGWASYWQRDTVVQGMGGTEVSVEGDR